MSTFQQSLAKWLEDPANTQNALAEAIGKTQVTIHRYADGARFPDADTARAIEAVTQGAVPFDAWRADFLARSGLAA